MIDTDDRRDYAEERANLADMRRELEGEEAFEQLRASLVSALLLHARAASVDAQAAARRVIEDASLRLPVNAHRYELLAIKQQTAHVAVAIATALDVYHGYDLAGVAQTVVDGWLVTHSTGRDDQLGRAARTAASGVLAVVTGHLDEAERRDTDAREQADRDETEAYLRRVTR